MTLSSAVANYGLSALATPTGTNVSNDVKVGVSPTSVGFSTADIAYSLKITATAANDAGSWNVEDHSWSNTLGTPTVTDGDGNDFEGVDLATAVTVYAALIEFDAANTGEGSITAGPDGFFTASECAGGCKYQGFHQDGKTVATMTIKSFAIQLGAIGDIATVTLISKSS